MHILLTNDDGIVAPGLLEMYKALSPDAEVTVVAPQTVQSGGSHAISIHHPVIWRTMQVADTFSGTCVDGTPADCVKLALNALLPEKPDWVVSGINGGLNTGIHVLYSGTVAAAIEAAIHGCPAIAVSYELSDEMNYAAAAHIAKRIIDAIMRNGPPPGCVFNVNIPQIKSGCPKGVRVARQSIRAMVERIEQRADPNGRSYYWLSGDFKDIGDEIATDRHSLGEGYVCVTPLQFNLTDAAVLSRMQEWSWPEVDV